MKKMYVVICFTSMSGYTQVGINTTEPQKDLHIAGSGSTIRIEGLNSTNNSLNQGTNTSAVHVNSSGDLVLPDVRTAEMLYNSVNAMPTSKTIQTTGTEVIERLFSQSVTLTRRAIVFISYNIPYYVRDYSGTNNISDGQAKQIGMFFRFGNASGPTSGKYGWQLASYTNHNASGVSGYFRQTTTDMVVLEAGTYYIYFDGSVYSGNSEPSAADFSVTFGGNTLGSTLRIIPVYY